MRVTCYRPTASWWYKLTTQQTNSSTITNRKNSVPVDDKDQSIFNIVTGRHLSRPMNNFVAQSLKYCGTGRHGEEMVSIAAICLNYTILPVAYISGRRRLPTWLFRPRNLSRWSLQDGTQAHRKRGRWIKVLH